MMTRGGNFLLIGGCLAASGCVTDQKVQVRPIADRSSNLHYSGGLLAEARGQLAMGAVGLALESLRTLQRQQPDNADVYATIAACYAQMGRYDISRHNYELALAYAPDDPALLQALAGTLDRLGESQQAAQVRDEVRMVAARRAQPTLAASAVTPLGVPRATAMTVKLPDVPRAAQPPAKQQIALAKIAEAPEQPIAPPKLSAAAVNLPTSGLGAMTKPALAAVEVHFAAAEDVQAAAMPALDSTPAVPILAPSLYSPARVDVASAEMGKISGRVVSFAALPTFKEEQETAAVLARSAPQRGPSTPPRVTKAEDDQSPITSGPYLERTSLREVALITVGSPKQRGSLPAREPQLPEMAMVAVPPATKAPEPPAPRSLVASADVRWLPLRHASRAQPIQLLNAARTDGLAARTRIALVDRGWRKVSIGNARASRRNSLVLYSPGRWHVAARLAAQFRCKAVRMSGMKNVVVLLGRDAAFRRGATSRA